jgi:PAS domain S-box-containing protein
VTGSSVTDTEDARLLSRIARLEEERRQSFEDAQREADTLFAQYQLSQLVASGGTTDALAGAILTELVRLADGAGGALWADPPDRPSEPMLALVAAIGEPPATLPGSVASVDAVQVWVAGRAGSVATMLADEAPRVILVVWPAAGRGLDVEGVRIAQLARHELAVALRGARLREVLDRERAELAAIVEGATDMIVGVDANGIVTRLNPAAARLLGVTRETAAGRLCSDVLGCDVAGGHGADACPFRRVLATGRPIGYLETAVRGSDGRPIRMAGSFAPLVATSEGGHDDDEALATPDVRGTGRGASAATAILRDVTAARALEELREGFVATVSHELRTPLALIRGYTETVLHLDLSPGERRTMIERIHEVTGRLSTLVDQILDITHLDADPVILERAPTSLTALIARLRGDYAAAGRDVALEVDVPADLPPLDADGARIGQVLENLVGNAAKYGPPGAPIRISARAAAGRATIAVEDEGLGVPEADRDLVLEPFHRAANVRESRIPGTGLGLTICRRLVEAHGGHLVVGARLDGRAGTRVVIDLPLAPARPRPAARATTESR